MFEVKKPHNSNKTIRMPDENDISFNQLVIQCCEYALDHMGQQEK